jgi:uncharacterized protein YidB (DUF937 family)
MGAFLFATFPKSCTLHKTFNMLDNLFNLVKSYAGDGIINNPAIPNEQNDEAVSVASNSIVDTLKNAATSGNIGDIMSMFNNGGNAAESPLASAMQSNMVQKLMQQFGLNDGAAASIVQSVLPNAINSFVSKTKDPNDSSFNIQDIIAKVAGNNSGLDIGGLVSQFTGGGNSGGGASNLVDGLKGLFGK